MRLKVLINQNKFYFLIYDNSVMANGFYKKKNRFTTYAF